MSTSGTYSVPGATLTHTHNNGIRILQSGRPHEQLQTPIQAQHIRGHGHGLQEHAHHLHQHHPHIKRPTAVSISVTTAAHGNPVRMTQTQVKTHRGQPVVSLMQQQQREQTVDMRIAQLGIVPPVKSVTALSPLPGNVPQTTTIRMRQGINLSPGLAKHGGGITLPNNKNTNFNQPETVSMRKVVQPGSSPAVHVVSSNSVYSSAGRASVSAQRLASRRTSNVSGNIMAVTTSQIQQQGGKYKYTKVVGGKPTVSRSSSSTPNKDISPQIFLDKLIKSRGYCTRNYNSLEGGYYCKPTPLQKASYGVRIVQAIRQSDDVTLSKMLKCGSSPNPSNAFGESVVHMVCRRGDYKMLKVFKNSGCSLQVTDDFGRTPLHDACWTAEPNFETVDLILSTDERMLHIVDCRGSPPLSYVKRDHWAQWIAFFQARADKYWPPRNITEDGEEPPPPLCNKAPHSRPIEDPPNAAPIDVAQLIASGKMTPDEYLARTAPSQVKAASPGPVSTPVVTPSAVLIAT